MRRAHIQLLGFCRSKLFKQLAKSSPVMLVDVGARGGIHPRWELIRESIKVLGFEPDLEECKRLNEEFKKNHAYLPIVLHNRSGTTEMNILRNPANSSIYLPNFSLWNRFPSLYELETTKSINVQCNTLDNILKANNIHNVDFLKIDTQGSELQVLQGARKTLQKSIFGVDVEVEFSQLYENQSLFADVDIYLRDLGFSLFDINLARLKRNKYNNVYSKGQVLWAHALYFKDFILNRNINSNYLNFGKTIRAIAIAELYGFSDFALELLDFYYNKRIIGVTTYENIKKLLDKDKLLIKHQLLKNMRSAIGNYLKRRIPSIYNLIKKDYDGI